MANPEHLAILRQGLNAWDKWRSTCLVRPDLVEADLSSADLSQANLSLAKLSLANLSRAGLHGADLNGADLHGADLSGADLGMANLSGANLNLAYLARAGLYEANLSGASLSDAVFSEANLGKASLSSADLREAIFHGANLSGANLRRANLSGANFIMANLETAALEEADLRWSQLVGGNLTGAKLTGAKLYGTARDEWVISGVDCKHVYWDADGKQRSPKDRDLQPGEFERIYEMLPTVEYVFENGMSPIDLLIMDRVVQAIQKKRPEFDIRIDSISARGLAPSIKFTVQHAEQKESALAEVRIAYETKIQQLEGERDRWYQLAARAIDTPKEIKLIIAGPSSIVSVEGVTFNIEQHVRNAIELQKAIAEQGEDSETFAKVAKKTALSIVGDVLRDLAKGQVKEAAKRVIELGKELGPAVANTAAYAFFKGFLG